MARISWDQVGEHFFEAGVDRGVLYVGDDVGVPWSGLISVNETPNGGEIESLYLDGIKYAQYNENEEYRATIEAYNFPKEFSVCNGTPHAYDGLVITHQPRQKFNLTYRTMVGNDLERTPTDYKLHMVYNALVEPATRGYSSHSATINPAPYSWDISAVPTTLSGFKPTSHVVVDTRYVDAGIIETLENFLYGTTADGARMPTAEELLGLFLYGTIIIVVDHGDGTFSVTGPDENVSMLDATTFQIISPTAVYLDADTYTISST